MKAIEIRRFGGPEVLQLVDRSDPAPGPAEALVRVRAAGVNFADTLLRKARYAVTPELPVVPGNEATGTVEHLGAGAAGPPVSTRVAVPLFFGGGHSGGYAELAVAPAALLVPIPDALGFEEAVALMVQGLTALGLTKHVGLTGKTVLVSAAAGGVGTLLVQLAKRAGAKKVVAAASSEAKLALARSLGADAGVDYTQPDWVERAREETFGKGPDVVYESAGGPVTPGSLRALAPLGRLVVYGALNIQSFSLGVPELMGMMFKNQALGGFAFAPLLATPGDVARELRELFDLATSGALRVVLGGAYPLAEAAEAHRRMESRSTTGKLVLVPGAPPS
jgi:NADPH2:quinone reductase